jgi:phosphoglycolate phosphatase/pyrophosphatase PpaX
MPTYETVIFDFDGTVGDTLPLIYQAFNDALSGPLGRKLSEAEIRSRFGPPDHQIIREAVAPEDFEAANDRYLNAYQQLHDELASAFDQMDALLHRCRDAGMNLGLVTGKSRPTALISLEAMGLDDVFGVIITGDDVDKPKPDPEGVRAALAALDHQPAHPAAFVGDSAADVQAGSAAGLTTIAVTWGSPDLDDLYAAGPDVICTTVDELAEALGAGNG